LLLLLAKGWWAPSFFVFFSSCVVVFPLLFFLFLFFPFHIWLFYWLNGVPHAFYLVVFIACRWSRLPNFFFPFSLSILLAKGMELGTPSLFFPLFLIIFFSSLLLFSFLLFPLG
jgi:hypothetical protein